MFKSKKNQDNNVIKQDRKRFDIVIIGGGQTGLTLAKHLIKKEINTLIIDKDDLGIKTSLNLKNLIKLAKRFANNSNLNNIHEFMSTLPQRLEHINKEQNQEILTPLMNNSFFEYIKGDIKEIDEYSLTINDEIINFKKLVFATGSYYEEPNLPNLNKEMYLKLDQVNQMNKFYESVAIYGTNLEALELGFALAKLGTNVFFFDENVNPLNNFDDNLEAVLKTEMVPERINWCLESKITNHLWSSDSTIRIEFSSQNESKFIDVQKIFITGNKRSETRNLNTKYDLPLNKKGSIIINNVFKIKENSNYYAIGDVNGIMMEPTQATLQAITLSKHLTGESNSRFNPYNQTFTINIEPEISFHGMNKHRLDYLNIKYNEFIYDFSDELNSKLLGQKGKIKLYTNEKHEILGVFIYGSKTRELISLFTIIQANKLKFNRVISLNLPFYSKSEILRNAALEYELEFVGFSKKLQKIKKKSQKAKGE